MPIDNPSPAEKLSLLIQWRDENLKALRLDQPLVVSRVGLDDALGFGVWESIATRIADLNYTQRTYGDVTEAQILAVFAEHIES